MEEKHGVKIGTLSEQSFKAVNLSDIQAIKGLIKFRSLLDKYCDMAQNYNIYEAGIVEGWNEDLLCLYIDLDQLIKKYKNKFTNKQLDILNKFMDGWTDEDIAEIYKEEPNNIEQILDTVCGKIKRFNDEEWLELIYLNYKRTPYNYKQCSRCREFKPITDKYFYKKYDNKDGFHNICIECQKT